MGEKSSPNPKNPKPADIRPEPDSLSSLVVAPVDSLAGKRKETAYADGAQTYTEQ
jgi:hypothetical protein